MATQSGKGEAYRYLVEAITSPTDTCMLWPYMMDEKGYGKILQNGKKVRVHRLVMQLTKGMSGLDVLHGCGNTRCFNPDHLRYDTAKENIEDARRHGTLVVGSRSPSSKLTEADIPNIIDDPRSHRAIGQAYGINHRTIGRIKKHEAWKHVTTKEV